MVSIAEIEQRLNEASARARKRLGDQASYEEIADSPEVQEAMRTIVRQPPALSPGQQAEVDRRTAETLDGVFPTKS